MSQWSAKKGYSHASQKVHPESPRSKVYLAIWRHIPDVSYEQVRAQLEARGLPVSRLIVAYDRRHSKLCAYLSLERRVRWADHLFLLEAEGLYYSGQRWDLFARKGVRRVLDQFSCACARFQADYRMPQRASGAEVEASVSLPEASEAIPARLPWPVRIRASRAGKIRASEARPVAQPEGGARAPAASEDRRRLVGAARLRCLLRRIRPLPVRSAATLGDKALLG